MTYQKCAGPVVTANDDEAQEVDQLGSSIDKTNSEAPPSTQAPVDIGRSNSLPDLAARIRTEHAAVSIALKDSVRHAIVAGEALIEAKDQLKHGQWLPWLRDHCTISERTAQLYMRCARSRTVIEEQIRNGVADLSLNEAAAMLMLSSDVRKLLEMTKTMRDLQGEELIKFCAANDIGMLEGNIFNAPEPTDQEDIDWHIFVLWLVQNRGWYVEGAFLHMDWVQSRGTRLADWMRPNPNPVIDAWRKPISQEVVDDWNTFLGANRSRSLDDLKAELTVIHEERGEMPPQPSFQHSGRAPKRKRRHA